MGQFAANWYGKDSIRSKMMTTLQTDEKGAINVSKGPNLSKFVSQFIWLVGQYFKSRQTNIKVKGGGFLSTTKVKIDNTKIKHNKKTKKKEEKKEKKPGSLRDLALSFGLVAIATYTIHRGVKTVKRANSHHAKLQKEENEFSEFKNQFRFGDPQKLSAAITSEIQALKKITNQEQFVARLFKGAMIGLGVFVIGKVYHHIIQRLGLLNRINWVVLLASLASGLYGFLSLPDGQKALKILVNENGQHKSLIEKVNIQANLQDQLQTSERIQSTASAPPPPQTVPTYYPSLGAE